MSSGQPNSILEYASSVPGALEPDEVILWQGAARPDLAISFRNDAKLEAQLQRMYFVTNRRIVAVSQRTKVGIRAHPLEPPVRRISIQSMGDKVSSVTCDGFQLKYLEDWHGLCKIIATRPRKSRHYLMHRGKWSRRAKRTKLGFRFTETVSGTMNSENKPETDDLPLLEGEKILWRGQPLKWSRLDLSSVKHTFWILIWLLVPVGVLAIRWLDPKSDKNVNWLVSIPASIWIIIALYSVLISPFVKASKRGRTRYFLSNVRGFVVESKKRDRRLEIVFLDGLSPESKLTENADGSGDIAIGHGLIFRGVPDSCQVHKLIMEAIQAANRTAESSPTS